MRVWAGASLLVTDDERVVELIVSGEAEICIQLVA